MSGIEVCRELRAGPLPPTVPIIMLTARSRPQDLEQGTPPAPRVHRQAVQPP
ncbi:hypothetical protein [Actinoplanes nipponensis]|uniref:hypothetical protein n=1 Tax=Actinoplanes nipponensis TaxID=135950 RepID=UPI0031EFED10